MERTGLSGRIQVAVSPLCSPPIAAVSSIDWAVGDSLRSLSDVDLEGEPMGPAAIIGKQVAIVLSNKTAESLLVFDSATWPKAATHYWTVVGKAGRSEYHQNWSSYKPIAKLQASGEAAKKRGRCHFPKCALAAPPAVQPNGLALAATNGQVWLIDPTTALCKRSEPWINL